MKQRITDDITKLHGPIVVLGAGGFVGAALLRRLLDVREDCYAIVRQAYVPWRLADVPSGKLLHGDVTRAPEIGRLFDELRFRTLFCFTGYGGHAGQNDADLTYRTNLLGLLNVLTAASRNGLSSLVHAGAVAPPVMDGHYAVSKRAASALVEYAGRKDGLPVIDLRYATIYGPREEPNRLVSRLVRAGLAGMLPPLGDPESLLDLVYVDDAVDAAVLAASRGVVACPGNSVDIVSGRPLTVRGIVETARRVLDIAAAPAWADMSSRPDASPAGEVTADVAKAALSWEPATTLEEGIAHTARWMRSHVSSPRSVPRVRKVKLSAVVACYRDGQAIPILHERLTRVFRELAVDYEILFVNDASPDDTALVLDRLCREDGHVVAIEHSRSFGSQSAFLSGMELATGDAVVLLDGDLQDPPELIAKFHERWLEGNEVVYGRRVQREAGIFHRAAYKIFYRVFRAVANVTIPLDAGDFALIDRRVVNELKRLPETDQFLRGLRAWVGFRQTGVDYIRPERQFGRSTNDLRKNFWWARKAIFSFTFLPLEAMLYGGMAVTALSAAGLVGQLAYALLRPESAHGMTTLLLVVLLLGGANILALSVLGEYVGKIVEESKRRPRFIRRALQIGSERITDADRMGEVVASRSAAIPPGPFTESFA